MPFPKIALEEAIIAPKFGALPETAAPFARLGPDGTPHTPRLLDIHQDRLALMDKYGVEHMVLSLTSPGVQDPEEAKAAATYVNDWLAEQVAQNPQRFSMFATLSMHDPQTASTELRRCNEQHKVLGVLVNDTQRTDNGQLIFYDSPEWDSFWRTCIELDLPFYLHPGIATGEVFKQLYKDRMGLLGPTMSFAHDTSLHLCGMITKGVFDRNPKLRVIVGHMGEKLPIDFTRMSNKIEKVYKPTKAITEMKHALLYYFKTNIYITTSGDFDSDVLKFVGKQVGYDRIMFSIDYPYDSVEEACTWFDGITPDGDLTADNLAAIANGNAKKILGLSF